MGSPAGERNDQSVLAVKAGKTDEERKRSEWDVTLDFYILLHPLSLSQYTGDSHGENGASSSRSPVPGRSSLSTHEFISSHQWCCAWNGPQGTG